MKTGTVVSGFLLCATVLVLGLAHGSAEPAAVAPASKIGIVSVRIVFRDCKANANYKDKALAEQDTKNAELDIMQKEIAAQEASLKALKPGSSDYLKQYQDLLNKQAQYEAAKQYNSQQRALKDRLWTEQLYEEVLAITKRLAQSKGLSLVLEVDEPEFPLRTTDELMMALQTHKVLYSGGCVDLTAEVTAEMDKVASKFKF